MSDAYAYNEVYVEGPITTTDDGLTTPNRALRYLTVMWGGQAASVETNLRTELFHWEEPRSKNDAIEGAVMAQLPGVWFPGRLVVETDRGPMGEPFAGSEDDEERMAPIEEED